MDILRAITVSILRTRLPQQTFPRSLSNPDYRSSGDATPNGINHSGKPRGLWLLPIHTTGTTLLQWSSTVPQSPEPPNELQGTGSRLIFCRIQLHSTQKAANNTLHSTTCSLSPQPGSSPNALQDVSRDQSTRMAGRSYASTSFSQTLGIPKTSPCPPLCRMCCRVRELQVHRYDFVQPISRTFPLQMGVFFYVWTGVGANISFILTTLGQQQGLGSKHTKMLILIYYALTSLAFQVSSRSAQVTELALSSPSRWSSQPQAVISIHALLSPLLSSVDSLGGKFLHISSRNSSVHMWLASLSTSNTKMPSKYVRNPSSSSYLIYFFLDQGIEEALIAKGAFDTVMFTPNGIAGAFALYANPGKPLGLIFWNEFVVVCPPSALSFILI